MNEKQSGAKKNLFIPQIKICGLTRVDEAVKCAELGADAIGCVFYPKSPRNVTGTRAKEISVALPRHVKTVGVFVNASYDEILRTVEHSFLNAVQLHGRESPRLVERLRNENIRVIKALFADKNPSMDRAADYDASAFLVECGKGRLPGGNALAWNWEKAVGFSEKYPLILAGGLTPDNVLQALAAAVPDAVDVSSGVESEPGRKNPDKVKAFIAAVSKNVSKKPLKRVF
jgi:phosphoribosylanthranilate isomerase